MGSKGDESDADDESEMTDDEEIEEEQEELGKVSTCYLIFPLYTHAFNTCTF